MAIDLERCSFHKDRPSISTCTQCHRFICSEDRKTLKNRNPASQETIELDFCLICYVAKVKDNLYGQVVIVVAVVFFALAMLFTPYGVLSIIVSLILLILVIIPLKLLFKQKAELSKVKKEKKGLLNSIHNNSEVYTSTMREQESLELDDEADFTSQEPKHLVCYQCGEFLSVDDKYCPNCGLAPR